MNISQVVYRRGQLCRSDNRTHFSHKHSLSASDEHHWHWSHALLLHAWTISVTAQSWTIKVYVSDNFYVHSNIFILNEWSCEKSMLSVRHQFQYQFPCKHNTGEQRMLSYIQHLVWWYRCEHWRYWSGYRDYQSWFSDQRYKGLYRSSGCLSSVCFCFC